MGKGFASNLDGDVHTGGQIELFQFVHGLGGRIENVDEPLVGALFEGFLRLLVRVRERWTVNFSMRVGSGMGPATRAPVRLTVSAISRADWSMTRKSYALRRILIR